MTYFAYDAERADGTSTSGQVEAESVGQALEILERDGLRVNSIRMLSEGDDSPLANWQARLEVAIRRRKELLPALEALGKELPGGYAKLETHRLANLLRSEMSVGELLYQPQLAELLPLFAITSEKRLDEDRLRNWLAEMVRQRMLRRQRLRALLYPAGLLLLAMGLLTLICVYLVPIFSEMFESFGLRVPLPTQVLIRISQALTESLPLVIAGVTGGGLLVFGGLMLGRHFSLRNYLFGRLASGTVRDLRAMSVLTSNLAELLRLGAPLTDALELAGRQCNHRYFAQAARQTALAIRGGLPARGGSQASWKLPSILLFAIETSRNAPKDKSVLKSVGLLRGLSRIYLERSQQRTDWFATYFPSASIFVVGIVVGFVVIALFTPLVTMVSALA